jgi:hypothetical protein
MKVTIVFKNGYSLSVTCESFTLKENSCGIYGYDIRGIKDHKPIYIKIEDVICIYRDIEAENSEEAEDGA